MRDLVRKRKTLSFSHHMNTHIMVHSALRQVITQGYQILNNNNAPTILIDLVTIQFRSHSTNIFQMTYYNLILKQNLIEHKLRSTGFYVEAGAGDGEIISNSLYFEIKYKVNYKILRNIYIQSEAYGMDKNAITQIMFISGQVYQLSQILTSMLHYCLNAETHGFYLIAYLQMLPQSLQNLMLTGLVEVS